MTMLWGDTERARLHCQTQPNKEITLRIATKTLKEQSDLLKACAVHVGGMAIGIRVEDEINCEWTQIVEKDNVHSDMLNRVINEIEGVAKELKKLLPEEQS